MSTAAIRTPGGGRRWLFGPVPDLALGCGLLYLAFFSSQVVAGPTMRTWLPLSLHPQPRTALLISYGAGNTAQALLSDPQLAQLAIVDLSPEILAASPLLHGDDDPLRSVLSTDALLYTPSGRAIPLGSGLEIATS